MSESNTVIPVTLSPPPSAQEPEAKVQVNFVEPKGMTIQPTREYRLRMGFRHDHNGVELQGGDVIQLTDRQGYAFRDKFECVDDKAPFTIKDAKFHEEQKAKLEERNHQLRVDAQKRYEARQKAVAAMRAEENLLRQDQQ